MKSMINSIVKKHFSSFHYFYQHLGYRIFLSLFLSLCVGLLDGFGLTMFLPLLQLVAGDSTTASAKDGMGGMDFIIEGFEKLGISMNIETVLLIIIIFFSAKGVAYFTREYYNVLVQLFFITNLRFRNIEGITNYKYKAFVNADSGRIQNTLSGEVARVSAAYKSYFQTVQAIIMMIVYIGLAFFTNPQFAILVILGGLVSNLAYRQVYKKTKVISQKITTGGHKFQSQLIQFVSHFKYLKSTALLSLYSEKMKESVVYIEKANQKIGLYGSILSATREPLNIIVVALVILAQVYLFSAALSGIILSLLFFYRALNYVMSVQNSWNSFLNVSGSLKNMTSFMQELKSDRETFGKKEISSIGGRLLFKNVYFSYDEEKIVLNNLSFEIPAKSTVAFVGKSGSGKTTIINLISGVIPVSEGDIYIDQYPYAEVDLRSLQSKIGYISQDPVIFSETIYDNITLWAPKNKNNEKRFWEACEQAAIAAFIKELQKGENTPLGNNGIQISGGQRQRIAIARELYKDIDILIMDEATSALDSEIELAIKQSIDSLRGRYTIVLVAHRLSTIKTADLVIMLKEGTIENMGTYQQLLSRSSTFKRMVELQEL